MSAPCVRYCMPSVTVLKGLWWWVFCKYEAKKSEVSVLQQGSSQSAVHRCVLGTPRGCCIGCISRAILSQSPSFVELFPALMSTAICVSLANLHSSHWLNLWGFPIAWKKMTDYSLYFRHAADSRTSVSFAACGERWVPSTMFTKQWELPFIMVDVIFEFDLVTETCNSSHFETLRQKDHKFKPVCLIN